MLPLRQRRLHPAWLGFALAACTSYTPAPVDLAAHASEFAARLPDAAAVHAFLRTLRPDPELAAAGIDLADAHRLALWANPELRRARAEAGVSAAAAAHAGRLPDPVLGVDLERILSGGPDAWITGGTLDLTVPLTGRLAAERALAHGEHDEALLAVAVAEAALLDRLDTAWAEWSALHLRAAALRTNLQQVDDLAQIASRLHAAGTLDNVAARAFALERTARRAELLQVEADLAAAALQRNRVLGLPPDRELPFVPTLAIAARAPEAVVATAADVVRDGPRLCLARLQHATAEHRLAAAVAAQWPDLHLLPGLSREDGETRALFGLSLPLPLWRGNSAAIAAAEARRDAAAAALRAALEDAIAELALADHRLAAAAARRALVDGELVPLAAQQLEDSRRRAEFGRLEPALLLDALTRSHAATAAAIDAALAEAAATIARNALFWPAPPPFPTEESR